MNLTNITSKDFALITKLIQKKEVLLNQVAEIDNQLSAFEGPSAAPAGKASGRNMSAEGRARIAAAQRARWAKAKGNAGEGESTGGRGRVSEQIVAALTAAGEQGMSVPELADKLGMKIVNVRAWIYTTGKKNGVKAIKRGVYGVKS